MIDEPLIRLLFVEDLPSDTELAERVLRKEGLHFSSLRVETEGEFFKALDEFQPDLIVSDYSMPEFDGLKALKISLKQDPMRPFIILTGSMNEETAVDCMKVGATDYVIKGHIQRLPFAIKEALEQKRNWKAREVAERQIREHQEELEAIYLNSPLIMILLDEERKVRKVNGTAVESIGHGAENLVGQSIGDALRCLHALDVPEGCGFGPSCGECTIRRTVIDTFQSGRSHQNTQGSLSFLVEGKKTELSLLLSTAKMTIRRQPMVLVTFLDVTKHKQMEETIRQSEERYRTVIEEIDEGYYEVDLEGYFTFVNDSMIRQLLYSREELIGMHYHTYVPQEEWPMVYKTYNRAFRTGEIIKWFPVTNVRKDGTPIFAEDSLSCRRDKEGRVIGFRGISRDMTERKKAEILLHETEERYKALFDRSLDFVYITDLEGRFIDANAAALNRFGYTKEELRSQNLASLLSEDQVPLALKPIQEILGSDTPTGLMEFRLRHKDGGDVYVEAQGSIILSNGKPVAIQGIARDISERKKAEEKLNHTLENLRKTMGGIIQVISATVETRDPYTAGHQRRTADLAWAIAGELGLTEDQRDGLLMAGTIHDLGKVSIPAEILVKPTQLTKIEFQLIQVHPQIGYDILKEIEFPWPVAEVVLQHHERMNGSGYPQGLRGEAISAEARILMVADVVEAMASYRPYRPALGIEAALEEIEKNQGILYDSRVVEACLRLFREKGFGFE